MLFQLFILSFSFIHFIIHVFVHFPSIIIHSFMNRTDWNGMGWDGVEWNGREHSTAQHNTTLIQYSFIHLINPSIHLSIHSFKYIRLSIHTFFLSFTYLSSNSSIPFECATDHFNWIKYVELFSFYRARQVKLIVSINLLFSFAPCQQLLTK